MHAIKTNRDPVVAYNEETMTQALGGLRQKRLAWQSDADRVPKYAQNLTATLNLVGKEAAVLCLILLRPPTAGELRSRLERLYAFSNLEEVFATLKNWKRWDGQDTPAPAGRKELRYLHLMAGEQEDAGPTSSMAGAAAASTSEAEDERIAAPASEVEKLRMEVERLRRELHDSSLF